MANPIIFFLLISAIGCANSARILDEFSDPQPPVDTTVPPQVPQAPIIPPQVFGNPANELPPPADELPPPVVPVPPPADELPPPVVPVPPPADELPPPVVPVPPPVVVTTPAPLADGPEPQPIPADSAEAPGPIVPPVEGPTSPLPAGIATTAKPVITFFMHDVMGGSHASGRVVTGIVATSDSSNIPFSKANNQVFPVSNGVPLYNNQINSIVNNNNAPVLASMYGQQQQQQSNTVFQNTGTSNNVINGGNNNNQAFVTAGQLPQGASLEELMFGSITVIDDEMTEGHELGSAVIGNAQGFYLASSLDGESHTMAWTATFHGGEHDQNEEVSTISFFGVHRVASPVSHVAVIGGTGLYENARGYATIESLPQVDQHTTDGVETIVHINVYIS